MLNNSLYSSNKKDWETPQFLFDKLNDEFGFSIDVCATVDNAKCSNFFTPKQDAITQEWTGVVWMNPPYGHGIDKWVKKAYEQSKHCICVCLLPVRSDTRWWHQYVMKSAEIRLLSKRLSFKAESSSLEGSNNKAPFPVAIVIFKQQQGNPKLSSMQI